MSKRELKEKVRTVLFFHYGFNPPCRAIILLEADSKGDYILCEINRHEYRIDGDTVEKLS